MKKTLMIAAALSLSVGYVPQAIAGGDDSYFSGTQTQCDASTCTVSECYTSFETGLETCSAIYSYPRPREVSGE
jgi:hypothetical protein